MATAWQRKFGAAGKACWKELKAGAIRSGQWGSCMRSHGIGKRKSKARRSRRK